jgi:hypothetical protein
MKLALCFAVFVAGGALIALALLSALFVCIMVAPALVSVLVNA